jgi:U3 small nucleolar ribonucleoprotein protein LCP5
VSLLTLKNQLLLSYCLNLAFYFYLKADGKRVKDHPVIQTLVELRLYLEKLKPIEQKLKYQIDKLVKATVTSSAQDDPLRYKPNPHNLALDSNGQAHDGDDDESNIYKAPKIAPVFFDEEPGAEDRRRKAAEKVRKRAASSRVMQELVTEMTDRPEEVADAGNMLEAAANRDKQWEDRIRAEEEMMLRLPMTRKDKQKVTAQKKFRNDLAVCLMCGLMVFIVVHRIWMILET